MRQDDGLVLAWGAPGPIDYAYVLERNHGRVNLDERLDFRCYILGYGNPAEKRDESVKPEHRHPPRTGGLYIKHSESRVRHPGRWIKPPAYKPNRGLLSGVVPLGGMGNLNRSRLGRRLSRPSPNVNFLGRSKSKPPETKPPPPP